MSPHAAKPARKKTTPAAPPKPEEVTVVGKFEDWPARAEIEALAGGKWHPTTKDFLAVANVPNVLRKGRVTDVLEFDKGTVAELVGAMKFRGGTKVERPDHSVGRLNIISHGNPGLLALAGKVYADGRVTLGGVSKETDASGDPKRQLDNQIDGAVLDWFNETELGKAYRDVIRKKLTPDAQVWLILCHGASGKAGAVGWGTVFAKQLANTLCPLEGQRVYAYRDQIWYSPKQDPKTAAVLDRTITSIGPTGKPGAGYYSMVEVFLDKAKTQRLGEHLKGADEFKAQHPKP